MRNLATIILFVLLTASAATAQLAPEHNISQPMASDSLKPYQIPNKPVSSPTMTDREFDDALPGIVSFTQQEREITNLIKQVQVRLDPDGQKLLLHMLKRFSLLQTRCTD